MHLQHYFITFVDLPEVLPFTLPADTDADTIDKTMEQQEESGKQLFDFVNTLEQQFQAIHYIGQDNIEGKFYQRFLFDNDGFMEVMQQAPVAIIAHFSNQHSAEQFANALKETILNTCQNDRIAQMLVEDIQVNEEKEESLSYEQWQKMKHIRESVV